LPQAGRDPVVPSNAQVIESQHGACGLPRPYVSLIRMKIIPSILLSTAILVLLTGCETSNTSTRIREKSDLFASLTPVQQKQIKAGVVEIGFTADMTYLALGKPAAKSTKTTPEGPVEMWTFHNYYPSAPVSLMPAAPREEFRANFTPGRPYIPRGMEGSQPPIASTTGGPQINLHLPELQSETLYVFFFMGKVFQIKLADADH
jgi:hypothetical protein